MNCVFLVSLQHVSETFYILTRIQRDTIINVRRSSCKAPVILVRYQWNLNFLAKFSKNTQLSNFPTISLVGAELFHAHVRTDTAKLIVAFCNFAKLPKSIRVLC
jgi:hypothetical protein